MANSPAPTEVTLDEIEVAPPANVPGTASTIKADTPPEANTVSQTANSTTQTSTTQNMLSNGDLPWAKVLLPTTSAGQGGLGEGRHGLKPETWVYGIFLDGDDCQQPIILGVIPRGPGAGSGRGDMGGGGSGGGSGGGGGGGNGGAIDTSGSGGGKAGSSGGKNAETAYTMLVRAGYSPQNAAGIVGNLLKEGFGGGDIQPTINERGGGGGYGIAQWTSPDRKAALRSFSPNGYATVEGQVQFLIHELRTKETKAERLLQNARNDVAASTLAFLAFERPKGYLAKYAAMNNGQGVPPGSQLAKDRIAAAQQFYQKMQGKATSASTPASGTSSTATPDKPKVRVTLPNAQ